MTLIAVTCVALEDGLSLIVATDSNLSAGYRWPRGPKLFPLGAACVIAFEGATEFAYPLLINAMNFIALSDHLSTGNADAEAIFERVRMDVSSMYKILAGQEYFDEKDCNLSMILAGWSARRSVPVVNRLHRPDDTSATDWQLEDVTLTEDWKSCQTFFAGNGDHDPVAKARRFLRGNSTVSKAGYAAFNSVRTDQSETAVGGAPQIALISAAGRKFVGTKDSNGRRFLLGHHIPSGATKLTYYDEALDTLR
jgi:hypothetical protein